MTIAEGAPPLYFLLPRSRKLLAENARIRASAGWSGAQQPGSTAPSDEAERRGCYAGAARQDDRCEPKPGECAGVLTVDYGDLLDSIRERGKSRQARVRT